MFLQILFICLLSNILSTISGEIVSITPVLPRSGSIDDYIKSIDAWWTPERIKNAQPRNFSISPGKFRSAEAQGNSTISVGPPTIIEGSSPKGGSPLKRAISSTGRQISTTGRILWQVGSYSYSCSGAVINSQSGDLIVTAAHCVYDTDTKTWFNNNKWTFVPAYANNKRPYGSWPARRFSLQNAWISSGNYNYDVAFVSLQRLSNKRIQDVVGSQGVGFNLPTLKYIYDFGYPANLDNAEYLKSCVGYARKSNYRANGYIYNGQGLPCTMSHGCSGGPWLQNVVESTGVGTVVSVNSFQITTETNVINGPYFDNNIKTLYDSCTAA